MKYNRDCKIELACSNDRKRTQFQNPYLDIAHKEIRATNGGVCVFVPVTLEDGDTGGYIPRELFPTVRNLKKQPCKISLSRSCKIETPEYVKEFKCPEGIPFPNVDMIKISPELKEDEMFIKFSLNVQLLKGACDAMGSNLVSFRIKAKKEGDNYTHEKGIELFCGDSNAVIMPILSPEEL